MTVEEFDEKWSAYLEEGHYGLDINHSDVIEYLDQEFEKLSLIPGFSYSQIKEKFGTLRFYTSGGDRLIDGMIWFAESMSGRICETCGNSGKLRNSGWLVTLCDEHQTERENRFKE